MANALVWSSDKTIAFEIIGKVLELGMTPVVAAIGGNQDADAYGARGAKTVYVVDDPKVKDLQSGPVADALAAIAKEAGASVILIGGSRRGKEVAPRLGAKMKAAVVTLAQSIQVDGDKLVLERMYLGGKTLATEVPQTETVIATIPSKLFELPDADASKKAEVKTIAPEMRAPQVKVVERKPRAAAEVNLEEAMVVVGAGRGFKSKDDLKLAFDLAQTLGGQVGCSRPLATDLGWLTDDYWIGLSGKEVKPKLYVAAGVSGQIQHTTGIRGSKVIVAVNTNKDAPIFKMADYGIVGDLYKVLPALNAAIGQQKGG